MNLYVGNLSWNLSDAELQDAFAEFGEVSSCRIVLDKETNRSRGFAFVEMPDEAQANAAISALDGTEIKGRAINVKEARPRESRPPGGGGGGYRGNRDRNGGGGGYRNRY